jgi:hypothetical protein
LQDDEPYHQAGRDRETTDRPKRFVKGALGGHSVEHVQVKEGFAPSIQLSI